MIFGCAQTPKTEISTQYSKPIELFFRPLTTKESMISYGSDSINLKKIQAMRIKNNGFDTLFFCLFREKSNLLYRSDVIEKYRLVTDSLQIEESDIRCFFRCDSLITVLKGDSFDCIFEGPCVDSSYKYRYNFSFKVDSAGVKLFPQFKQFPCETNLPIR